MVGTWPAQGEEEGGELRGHQINLNGTGPSPHCEVEASTWPLEVEGGSVGDTPYPAQHWKGHLPEAKKQ